MARALKGRSKIWVRPFASNRTCKELSKEEEEADVYIDDEENVKDGNKSAQNIMENIQERANEVSQNFLYDTELQEQYKQLLVRAVAERMKRKMPEKEMWEEIERETGFNHRIVWQEMRKAIIQKIMRLLPANDLLKDIPTEMQLSPNDWLFFDLILVHEQIDVINNDSLTKLPDQCSQGSAKGKKEEPQCLQELFELVKHYDIENLVGEALMAAWTSLTSQYNSRGRHCSPMMLQLRWYQMKKYTRSHFYNTYAHNSNQDIQKTLEMNVSIDLTVLQLEIAVLYNKIITQEYPSWETLIDEKLVILFKEFSTKSLHNENKTNPIQAIPPRLEQSNEPPLLLIELNENQLDDFDKIKNAVATTITDDTIVIDLKNDKEYITELQKVMAKSIESSKQAEINDFDGNEEFKLRMVRELAKMELRENKKLNKLTWQRLNIEMGRDCKDILNKMRNVIVKKLLCLLAANDISQDVSPEMQLSESDWLLFDHILVHEKIYSVNIDLLETKCLRVLVNLVVAYQVEDLSGEELAEAWLNLTLNYNRGGRQCSPMLLQLRWHQLKEFARTHIYKQSAILNRYKNKMLMAIAGKYQKIITQQLGSWYALVKQKIVILPEEFIRILNQKGKWKEVEPREGWYLHVKEGIHSSIETTITSDNITYLVYDLPQTVEQTPEVSRNQVTITANINEKKEPEIIELDSDDEMNEILREKADEISNISQEKVKSIMNLSETQFEFDTVNKNDIAGDKSKNQADVDQVVPKPVTPSISNDEPIVCDSDDEMDKLLQEKANLMSIELPENLKDLDTIIGDEVDEFKKVNNSKICGMEVEEVGIINKEMEKNDNQNEALDEADFDENNIEFVDDGIQFEEGNEFKRTETKSTTDSSSDSDDDSDTDESKDEPQIDVKLLMDTKVSTKRIDGMEVFKFIEYESIRDKRLIEHLEAESKPVRKQAPKTVDIESCKEVNSRCDSESVQSDNDTETSFQEKIKYTSWLLQKPRKRKYTSRQLTKNPDFNTQLKILTPGFLISTSNRELLKECQPLTIDLHKTFEKKLVNGTMYLQRSNFKSHNIRENQRIPDMLTENQNTKLAEHVRDLIAAMTADSQDESDSMTSVTPTLPVRSKVINLPDKDQIRLINQNLLTAEITPRHQPLLNIPADDTDDDDDAAIVCSEDSPNKRLKTNYSSEPRSSNGSSLYCCWAREKISRMDENLDCSHMCLENCCTCCCRLDLATNLTSKNPSLQTPNTSSNISNPSSVDTNNSNRINNSVNTEISSPKLIDNMETSNRIKNSVNTEISSPKLMDNMQTSNRINNSVITEISSPKLMDNMQISNRINNSVNTEISSPKLMDNMETIVTMSTQNRITYGNKSLLKINVKNAALGNANTAVIKTDSKGPGKVNILAKVPNKTKVLNYTIDYDKYVVRKKAFAKSKVPLHVVKPSTSNKDKECIKTMPPLIKIAPRLPDKRLQKQEVPTYVILPPGVNFVKLADQEIALAINPGVQLEPAELQSLMSVCASMNASSKKQNVKVCTIPNLLLTNG